ncbi:hypothetical protein D9611_010043 [Ephemerocybe angulata]|uniref:Uncharacterized protein n=1 Tax=Ephemerocybe angulata TaxID=980116 RepID=A0A8H5C6K7_9AGAR|nr:hypothetical protein D9611_010043 [Tulosesus angulatus]
MDTQDQVKIHHSIASRPRKSRLPAHARPPKHKCIGRLPTVHSSSIKTPIARSSIVCGAFHTRAAPRATASTGTARTERNARLWNDRQRYQVAIHPPPPWPPARKSRLPANTRTPEHEYIGRTVHSPSISPTFFPAPRLTTRAAPRAAPNTSQPEPAETRVCVGWGCADGYGHDGGDTAELKQRPYAYAAQMEVGTSAGPSLLRRWGGRETTTSRA